MAWCARIGWLSYSSPDLLNHPGIQATLALKSCYCAMHGYQHIFEVSPFDTGPRTSHWHRIPFLLKHLRFYDWIFYSDADTVVTNASVRLEDFVNIAVAAQPDTFFVIQDDMGLNRRACVRL